MANKYWGSQFRTINRNAYIFALCIMLVFVVFLSRPFGNAFDGMNYRNSDATHHALLTMTAYDESKAEDHRYLPTVSLGGAANKGYKWGATVPDKDGNFYYTSFAPLGFLSPYAAFKLFGLGFSESNILLFNSALLFISLLVFSLLLSHLFRESENKVFIVSWGLAFYAFMPEVLHGMGPVYWHQSLMQVLLPLQLYAYLMSESRRSGWRYIFYITILVTPLVEWSGYVANFSYFVSSIHVAYKNREGKQSLLSRWSQPLLICVLTGTAGVVFILHYASKISFSAFLITSLRRCNARSVSKTASLACIIKSYLVSFGPCILVILIALVATVTLSMRNYLKESILCRNKCVLFLASFVCIENILMGQHAYVYTYDRMKWGFPLVLILCDCAHAFTKHCTKTNAKYYFSVLLAMYIVSCVWIYRANPWVAYYWQAPHKIVNKSLVNKFNSLYEDKQDSIVLGTHVRVRGYLNLLFHRSICERTTQDQLLDWAKGRGALYAAYIIVNCDNPDSAGNVYEISNIEIYCVENRELVKIIEPDGITND